MMDRGKYLDDYGTQVDPLFDMVDDLERQIKALREVAQAVVDSKYIYTNANGTEMVSASMIKVNELLIYLKNIRASAP